MKKVRTIALLLGGAFAVAGGIIAARMIFGGPLIPKGPHCQFFDQSRPCAFDMANPRFAGDKSFKSPGPNCDLHAIPIPGDIEWYDYRCQVITVVELADHRYIVPFVVVSVTLEGGYSHASRVQAPAQPDTGVFIPLDSGIVTYSFLIRSFVEETGWRVYKISAKELVKHTHPNNSKYFLCTVPDLMTLPEVGADSESKKYWDYYLEAVSAFDKAGGRP